MTKSFELSRVKGKLSNFAVPRAVVPRENSPGMPVANQDHCVCINQGRRKEMKPQSVTKIIQCFAGCAVALTIQAAQLESASYLRAPHRAALQRWLPGKPALRLATEKDCLNKEGLKATRQENGQSYQPYYAVGDFNGDGQEDFAVALINQGKRSRKFSIAIFNGPFKPQRSSLPNFLTEGVDLSTGGLVVLSGNRLVAGVFQSDDCVVLRPSRNTYVMKTCL